MEKWRNWKLRKWKLETVPHFLIFSFSHFLNHHERSEKGAVIVLVAVGMLAFLGIAALVIDLGYRYITTNQLHVAADGGSLAGAALIVDSSDCGDVGGSNYSAREEAQKFAAFHLAGGKDEVADVVNLDLNTGNNPNGDVVLGNFTRDRGGGKDDFIHCDSSGSGDGFPVNAVRVHARRNSDSGTGIDASNAPITTFFGPVVGFDEIGAKAFATAIGGVRGDIPICIPSCVVDNILNNPACEGTGIALQPDSGETAVWTSFFDEQQQYDRTSFYINNPDNITCETLQGREYFLKNGGPNWLYTELDDQVNDDPGSEDGVGQTVTLDTPLPVILPVCKWEGCAGTCSTGSGYGSGSGSDLEVVGHVVFNITSVQDQNIGNPPRICDADLDSLPKGICGDFSVATTVVGANCSGLVE